jgi:hypothetical protein
MAKAKGLDRRKEVTAMSLPELPVLKKCAGCGVIVELGTDQVAAFFDVDGNYADGFKRACKQCRKKRREMMLIEARKETRSKVDKLIGQMIDKATFGGSDVPHIAEVYAKAMALMGGANGFAMALMDTYLEADAGSAVRQKILGQLMHLGTAVTQTGAAQVPDELLSDEELEKKIKRLAKRARVIDSTVKVHKPDEDDDLRDSTEGERRHG